VGVARGKGAVTHLFLEGGTATGRGFLGRDGVLSLGVVGKCVMKKGGGGICSWVKEGE